MILATLTFSVLLALQGHPATCATIAAYHRLDFWLGSWNAYDAKGDLLGTDMVSSILAGCAIEESWSDADGSHGLGIIYYDNVTNQWTKLYLTEQGNVRGGATQRVLVAEYPDGGVRFQGVISGASGESRLIDRTTIRPMPDGRIHYVKEITKDGGDRWITTFEAFYVRSLALRTDSNPAAQRIEIRIGSNARDLIDAV